jgi:uncharacterized protein YbjT (DUF2867 family)
MYVVAGVSGNTGKVVAETLLSSGKKIRVVVRDAKKGEAWKKRGAEVAVAELDDAEALTTALRGAEGAYLLLPPQMASTSVRADNAKRAASIAKAIDASGIKHVVFLSSIGSQHAAGTGPILSTYDGETLLGKSRADVTFLRAGYFMENIGASLFALADGKLPMFLREDHAIPMVAAVDIGTTAAKLLVEGGHGKHVVELGGPREYSPRDAAATLTKIVGHPVVVAQGPEEAMIGALTGAGLNAEWARLYQEMTHGVNTGHVSWEDGRTRVRGGTELEVVLRQLVAGGAKSSH